jgi:hypothetical protein
MDTTAPRSIREFTSTVPGVCQGISRLIINLPINYHSINQAITLFRDARLVKVY